MPYHFHQARSLKDRLSVFTVRYQIFVEEKHWIEPTPLKIEFDDFDHFSRHLLVVNDNHEVIGTVRMIDDSPLGFPYEKVASLPSAVSRDQLYEVSRLSVLESERGQRSLILVGLCRAVWRIATRHSKTHWCAVVDRPVARLLKTLGFEFVYQGMDAFHLGSLSTPLICSMSNSREVLFSPRATQQLADHIEEAYDITEA